MEVPVTYFHPAPDEIRKIRLELQLTPAQAAALAGLNDEVKWRECEEGKRSMCADAWEQFLINAVQRRSRDAVGGAH